MSKYIRCLTVLVFNHPGQMSGFLKPSILFIQTQRKFYIRTQKVHDSFAAAEGNVRLPFSIRKYFGFGGTEVVVVFIP